MNRMEEILVSALERTRSGRLSWTTTADRQVFLAILRKGALEVGVKRPKGAVASMTEPEDSNLYLRVLDENGGIIEEISGHHSHNVALELTELNSLARHSALNIDRRLDQVLEQLKA